MIPAFEQIAEMNRAYFANVLKGVDAAVALFPNGLIGVVDDVSLCFRIGFGIFDFLQR